MKRLLLSLLLVLPLGVCAKSHISNPDVKSLQVVVNANWLAPAVMRLGSQDVLTVAFDELSHDYHRYIYRLEHCEADWTPSEGVFESDWLEGFNGNTIDDYEHSSNTIIPYTHYQLQLPNDRCRLKLSGNYRLHVLDEDDDEREVLVAEFMVTEQTMKLSMSATANTDIDTHQERQQRCGLAPTITTLNGLEWSHHRQLIFDAGNEYRKFEVLDVSHPTMGIDHITWDGENYQAYPYVDEPRPNYLYDEDANGAFCIRNSDNSYNDTHSEYLWVNFRLRAPEGLDIYISGRWTTEATAAYRMQYDASQRLYTASILLKQGYYNYQYLLHTDELLPSEGSYYQTENHYQAFIYYKGTTDRTWRLTCVHDTAVE